MTFQTLGHLRRSGALAGAGLLLGLAACASVSTSAPRELVVGSSVLEISARAERGATRDELVVSVDGVDVARGPFGPPQAAGTVLQGSHHDIPVEARCRHRWRLGLQIGYRCAVTAGGEGPVELDF